MEKSQVSMSSAERSSIPGGVPLALSSPSSFTEGSATIRRVSEASLRRLLERLAIVVGVCES